MWYAFLFSTICFVLSCLGASIVFFFKKGNDKANAFLHSFASGIMIASGIFSLIIPSISYCNDLGLYDFIILPICFAFSGVVIFLLELFSKEKDNKINKKALILGIMLHNIPEGMCVGFAFASASFLGTNSAFMSAVMIAIGIGVQNIPEGSSVSFPLYSSGASKLKSFFASAGVAFVEVPFAIISYFIGSSLNRVLPFMLAFAGGLMISVAVVDLLPEAIKISKKFSLIWFFVGFILMMLLDLALG